MVKKSGVSIASSTSHALQGLILFVAWVTGVLVALSVGFGMIDGILSARFIPLTMTIAAGWVVIVLSIIGALLAVIERLSR
ncbi:hypothetical protein CO038_02920 [Candidatus Pacearchaeota archaeon CG_4_9_14_0_2_um_filter_39_13]|nr:hypothetical protein [Candidatus Pacearchaeota archaeon]OIO44388.1 MAG: hypothetical protein AUJ64_00220 [Candidatus Pacearchaeota archaeon CG1_02_39_14]PJC44610.1 MAG: hypothetical protein CO038_02920 [Candidatus Pacearchaeota archaeon CG_4_9_14_0_2_um_filter_39_13]